MKKATKTVNIKMSTVMIVTMNKIRVPPLRNLTHLWVLFIQNLSRSTVSRCSTWCFIYCPHSQFLRVGENWLASLQVSFILNHLLIIIICRQSAGQTWHLSLVTSKNFSQSWWIRELTPKFTFKCLSEPMNFPLNVSPSNCTRQRKKSLTSTGIKPTTFRFDHLLLYRLSYKARWSKSWVIMVVIATNANVKGTKLIGARGTTFICIVGQSVSQSHRQSVSQSISQSVYQSVSRSVSGSVSHSVSQLVSQSIRQSVSQSISQSFSQSVGQSVYQSVGQSVCWSLSQSISQSVIQSVSLSVSHSISLLVTRSVYQSVSHSVSRSVSQVVR